MNASVDSNSPRLPPLTAAQMNEAQRAAAEALIAGPRGAVKGPFIALLRSPELMDRVQRVGEYLRFNAMLPARINEFVTCVVSRTWTQQFEWRVHAALAAKAGVAQATLDALAQGARPTTMADDEAVAYDFTEELQRTHGVCDATYERALRLWGEQGVVDLIGLIGYFTLLAMVLNVARTPPEEGGGQLLAPLPR